MEETLSIIKPDGVSKNLIGTIIKKFEDNNLKIINIRFLTLNINQASEFYYMHKGQPFYEELVNFMTSGPCVPFVIQGDNAILKVREIMGATNPDDAKRGTIRSEYADSIDKNIIHGSDSPESAKREISFFFP